MESLENENPTIQPLGRVRFTVGICKFVYIFYKLRCSTPWYFGKILRSPLRSWGFQYNFLHPMFLEYDPKFSVNLVCSFHANWTWGSVPAFWFSHILFSGLRFTSTALSFRRYLGILCVKRGSKVLGGTASILQAMYGEVLSLPSIIVVLIWRRYRQSVFPFF